MPTKNITMGHQGDGQSRLESGHRCPHPDSPRRVLTPQDNSSYQGGYRSPSKSHPQPIHGNSPYPRRETNISLSQKEELPRHAPRATDLHVQSDGDPTSQLGERPTCTTFPPHKCDQLLKASNNSHSQGHSDLAGAEPPAAAPRELSAAQIQASAAAVEFDETEHIQQLEMLQSELKRFFVRFAVDVFDILLEMRDLEKKLQGQLEHLNAQGHRCEPIKSASAVSIDKKQSVEVKLKMLRRQTQAIVSMKCSGWHDSDLLKSTPIGFEAATSPNEASPHGVGIAATYDQTRTESVNNTMPACQATSTDTKHGTSTGSQTGGPVVDSSHHPAANEIASERAGVDPQKLADWISSRDFKPSFTCIVMLCHVRSNSAEEFRKHLLVDHQDVFQGSGVPSLHTQLDAAALEVCFGGKVPSFAQECMDGAFRTALPSPQGSKIKCPATIDTFGIPLKGQSPSGRR